MAPCGFQISTPIRSIHSPLLRPTWFSAPPLPTDMLKFGRSLPTPSGCTSVRVRKNLLEGGTHRVCASYRERERKDLSRSGLGKACHTAWEEERGARPSLPALDFSVSAQTPIGSSRRFLLPRHHTRLGCPQGCPSHWVVHCQRPHHCRPRISRSRKGCAGFRGKRCVCPKSTFLFARSLEGSVAFSMPHVGTQMRNFPLQERVRLSLLTACVRCREFGLRHSPQKPLANSVHRPGWCIAPMHQVGTQVRARLPRCFPFQREGKAGGDDRYSRSRVVPEAISLSAPPLEIRVLTEKPSAERGDLP